MSPLQRQVGSRLTKLSGVTIRIEDTGPVPVGSLGSVASARDRHRLPATDEFLGSGWELCVEECVEFHGVRKHQLWLVPVLPLIVGCNEADEPDAEFPRLIYEVAHDVFVAFALEVNDDPGALTKASQVDRSPNLPIWSSWGGGRWQRSCRGPLRTQAVGR